MKYVCLFIILFLNQVIFAQREADNIVYGVCIEGNACDSPFSTGVIKFDDDSIISISNLPINGSFQRGSSASISDTLGNLLLAFNGKYLYKSDGAIVDTFFYGLYDTMTVAPGHGLLLKLNKSDNEYYLLNSYGKFINNHPTLGDYDPQLYISVVKKETDFWIEEKSIIILSDSTTPGQITACRHANGRDWWVLKSGIYKNKFFIGLLNPEGIIMNTVYTNVANDYQSSVAFNFFSTDGTKFFHYAGFNDRILWEYDFDRCLGTLSNPIEHSLFDLLDPYDVPPMCPSPDGKLIYIRKSNPQTFQVELLQLELENNQVYLIDIGTFGPILSPNNKWIINCRNVPDTISTWGSNWLDIVYNPNGIGVQSNYESLVYSIPNLGLGALPNYANFRLGPIDGSPCDTLGLDNPASINVLEKEVLDCIVYPNPWVSELQIKLARSSEYTISLTDMLGKLLYSAQFNGIEHQLDLSGQIFSEGIYWVEIVDTKRGLRAGKKIVRKPPGG